MCVIILNMKAITKILAVTVAAVGAAALAGCSKSSSSSTTATFANWNVRTATSVEGNFTERWLNNSEIAEYSVSLEKGYNGVYGIDYNEGASYQTAFGMVLGSVLPGMPEGYKNDIAADEPIYYYSTALSVSGSFYTKSGETKNVYKEFNDSVTSVCYFRLAGDNLKPLYSQQQMKTTAPNSLSASPLSSTYIELNCAYTTYYNADCTEATIMEKNLADDSAKETKKKVGLGSKAGYSVFDNSQLRAAVRAFNIKGGASHTFNVLVPQNGGMQTCHANCSSPTALDAEKEDQAQIIGALDACAQANPDYIFFDKGEGESARAYRYNSVTMGINPSTDKMTGTSPSFWYSTVENSEINSTKCVLLRMSTPLAFGLGTVNYTLKNLRLISNAE